MDPGFGHDQRSPRRTGNGARRPRPTLAGRYGGRPAGGGHAPRPGPKGAPPWRRFPRGAFGLFPGPFRSAPSATRYEPLPCEETHRRPLRLHGPCFGGCRKGQERTGAMLRTTHPRQTGGPDIPARRELGGDVGAGVGEMLAGRPGPPAPTGPSRGPDGRGFHRRGGPGLPGRHAPAGGRIHRRRLPDEGRRGRDHPVAPFRAQARNRDSKALVRTK